MNVWPKLGSALSAALVAAGCAGLQGSAGSAPAAGSAQLLLADGSDLARWKHVGPGRFVAEPEGSIVTEGGMGLLYFPQKFRDFALELDYKADSPGANSGIFVRFPDEPATPTPPISTGYEIQIDDEPGGTNYDRDIHLTGAVYDIHAPSHAVANPAGQWNHYRIEVVGQRYQIFLNGTKVNDFFGNRGREGYIGLQNHDPDSRVHFRNVRVTPLDGAGAPETLADFVAVGEQRAPIRVLVVTATQGFRHTEAIDASKALLKELERTTEFRFDITEDIADLNAQKLAQYDLLFFNNSTLRTQGKDSTETAQLQRRGVTLVSPAQEQAVLEFARGAGKGVVVTHAGLDAFYGSEGYRELVGGGLFQEHPWVQSVKINVEDPTNPAVDHLGDSFWIRDEIYVLDKDPRWNSRVLLSLDMPSVGVPVGHADATVDDHPMSWIRSYGQGKVFVTKLGHFGDVWRNPAFVRHLLTGMREAAGRVPADFSGHRVKETVAKDVWPDDIVADERGNVWIAELTGDIYRYDAASKQTQKIASIPTTDPTNIEHGVFGIEIDPNFYSGEQFVYIYYAQRESFINTLSRFAYRDGQIDLASEKVLLRVPTEPSCCHQAGDLEWGPNQTLFISTGDTGQSSVKPEDEITVERIAAFEEKNALKGHHWSRLVDSERTAQNLQELRGKVLRINKDGTIPKDNPFYGKPGVRWEIYAYGLRNPYRIKYDAPTGRVYIGIVGPDENVTYDWYDVSQRGGENFGWPRVTGRLLFNEWTPAMIPNYVPSLWEYTYTTGSRSATFGPIYRSEGKNAFPDYAFKDKVFVYDWSRRWIKWGDVVNGTWESDTVASVRTDGRQFKISAKRLANLKTFDVLTQTSPISMELGRDGCLYVAEFDGFWRPAPARRSNVSRYCWIDDDAPAPGATSMAPPAGTPGGGSH